MKKKIRRYFLILIILLLVVLPTIVFFASFQRYYLEIKRVLLSTEQTYYLAGELSYRYYEIDAFNFINFLKNIGSIYIETFTKGTLNSTSFMYYSDFRTAILNVLFDLSIIVIIFIVVLIILNYKNLSTTATQKSKTYVFKEIEDHFIFIRKIFIDKEDNKTYQTHLELSFPFLYFKYKRQFGDKEFQGKKDKKGWLFFPNDDIHIRFLNLTNISIIVLLVLLLLIMPSSYLMIKYSYESNLFVDYISEVPQYLPIKWPSYGEAIKELFIDGTFFKTFNPNIWLNYLILIGYVLSLTIIVYLAIKLINKIKNKKALKVVTASILLTTMLSTLIVSCSRDSINEEMNYLSRSKIIQIENKYKDIYQGKKYPILGLDNNQYNQYQVINPVLTHSSLDIYEQEKSNDTISRAYSLFEDNYEFLEDIDSSIEAYIDNEYDVDNYKFVINTVSDIEIELVGNTNYSLQLVKYDNSLNQRYESLSLIKSEENTNNRIIIHNASVGHYVIYVYSNNQEYTLEPYRLNYKIKRIYHEFNLDEYITNNEGILVWDSYFDFEDYNYSNRMRAYNLGKINQDLIEETNFQNDYVKAYFKNKTSPYEDTDSSVGFVKRKSIIIWDLSIIDELFTAASEISSYSSRYDIFFGGQYTILSTIKDKKIKLIIDFENDKVIKDFTVFNECDLNYAHLILLYFLNNTGFKLPDALQNGILALDKKETLFYNHHYPIEIEFNSKIANIDDNLYIYDGNFTESITIRYLDDLQERLNTLNHKEVNSSHDRKDNNLYEYGQMRCLASIDSAIEYFDLKIN